MTAQELREKYFAFFKGKGHSIIPSASLIPENDPTVLFTTAGMHPLVPYLLGEAHPAGKRLVNVQKCVRTGDIDEVGDAAHLTFFEMLGNWSLGDYFKTESISWSWEFLTAKKWLGIDSEKLYITVYEGDSGVPKDEESIKLWQEQFKKAGIDAREGVRIFPLGREDNWWGPAGQTGPCGPDTEIFYDTGKKACGQKCQPGCGCGKYVEIWNNVFMEYNKRADGSYVPLKQKNVDTGMGIERTVTVLNGEDSVFSCDTLAPVMAEVARLRGSPVEKFSPGELRSTRIIADHIRAAAFILAERVRPSNVERGYVLRRLIRRSIRYAKELGITDVFSLHVAKVVIAEMGDAYPELKGSEDFIVEQLMQEEEKFKKAIEEGLRAARKIFASKKPIQREKFIALMQEEGKSHIIHRAFEGQRHGLAHSLKKFGISEKEFDDATVSGEESFYLYQSFGLPIEMILELAREKDLFVSVTDFNNAVSEHQKLSRSASSGKFKGGLADHGEMAVKYHTATHLLHAALRQILGEHAAQKGSNITAERLRFDFVHPQKMTQEEIKQVEDWVNDAIKKNYPVSFSEMSVKEAKAQGAMGLFEGKYADKVKVYSISDVSREICGGPHVAHTGELGKFKITKEESASAGVRRIRAALE